jgi:hypothetical protein
VSGELIVLEAFSSGSQTVIQVGLMMLDAMKMQDLFKS